MKRVLIVLIGVFLAGAAVADNNGWGFFGSYWDPSDGDSTFGPGTRLTIEMFPQAMLDIRLSYFNDLLDDDAGDLEAIPLDVGLTVDFLSSDNLWLYGGVGVDSYFLDGYGADDEIGFHALGGVDITIKDSGNNYGAVQAGLFAEVMYRDVDINTSIGDLDLSGVDANAGLMIRW